MSRTVSELFWFRSSLFFNSAFVFVKRYELRLFLIFRCVLTGRAGEKLQGTYPKVYY